MDGKQVLVTGGSGFVGSHCILRLIDAGYTVRTSVRDLKREAEVRAMLAIGGMPANARLSFVAADLSADAGWTGAVAGCDYVLHVASPFPLRVPKHEDELIVPAREGALRVLRAARDGGVKRVVLTSSYAAIGYGYTDPERVFTEEDWTDVTSPDVQPYAKSKTLAERAAWDFIAKEGNGLELSVVNPAGIYGPVLGPDYSTSIELVKRLMDGALPGCPRIWFGIVDVRDVADLHLSAMTNPAAAGQRFLALSGESMSVHDVATALRARLGAAADRVPARILPDWLVRVAGLADASLRGILPELGKPKHSTNAKAVAVLGWSPRSREDAVVATAESLIRLGLLGRSQKAA